MTFDPKRTVFVVLSFEGPDRYSQAGGLGVRVDGLSHALAQLGYHTYLYFCGDPDLPGEEEREAGRLHYRRWCQWISANHRGGVYDGEEDKIRDWNASLPAGVVDGVIAPAVASGGNVVVLGEEWHTSWSMQLLSDLLWHRGLRDKVVMLWNANNTYGFHRIDWARLAQAATLTTVSRYMKLKMWDAGQNPMVIPNGIPRSALVLVEPEVTSQLRSASGADHFWFKIGRFDPDKRWLMAVAAAGSMKRRGHSVKLVTRGGQEAHATEVFNLAGQQGLEVRHVEAPADAAAMAELMRANRDADVINLTSFVNDGLVTSLYAACDAVLANSGHEPFGLVGLEVMAAGGLAVTGSTGEDYAEAYRNALVLETDDPIEIVIELMLLKQRPRHLEAMRRRGRVTARDYLWEKVIDRQLLLRVGFAAARQAVKLADDEPRANRPLRKAPRKHAL